MRIPHAELTATDKPAVEIKTIPDCRATCWGYGALVESVPVDVTTSDTVGTHVPRGPASSPVATSTISTSPCEAARSTFTFSSSVLRPAATVPALVRGSNSALPSGRPVTWRGTGSDASTVSISGQRTGSCSTTSCRSGLGEGALQRRSRRPGAYVAVFGPEGKHRHGRGRLSLTGCVGAGLVSRYRQASPWTWCNNGSCSAWCRRQERSSEISTLNAV